MKTQIEIWAAWILVRIQIVTAKLDPEILQWPGGIVIALLFWLCFLKGPRFALSVQTGRSCGNAWRPSRAQLHRRL